MLIYFLDQYHNIMTNAGCNDVPSSLWKGWTKKEKQQFVKEFEDWNSEGRDYDPSEKAEHFPDSCLVELLRHKLELELEND